MEIASEFFRFCVVGTIGFAVDAGSLQILVSLLGAGPYAGRVVSFILAATATWILNRVYTFRSRAQTKKGMLTREWLVYMAVMVAGAAVNYGTYAFCIYSSEFMRGYLFLAVGAGSIAGLLINFLTAKYVVFRVAPKKNPR